MGLNFSAWSDRLNPVLVKEVRQATRSRSFTIVLLVALAIASFMSGGHLMSAASRGDRVSGKFMLATLAGVYSWLIRIYVVLSAFQSTTEEYAENTIDQLLLSSLCPWTIAFGKFQASVVLILLLLSAFLPFAAVTFLMEGVGLEQFVLYLGLPTIKGVGLVALAVLAGALARNKGLRILFVSILVVIVFAGGAQALLMARFVGRAGMLGTSSMAGFGFAALLELSHVLLLLGFASAALSPPAEDRSSIPRRAFSVWFVIQVACLVAMASILGAGSPLGSSVGLKLFFLQTMPILALFMTERNGLPRSAKLLPKGKFLRHLRNLWLPGGERAVGFLLLHLGALVLVVLGLRLGGVISSDHWLRSCFAYCVVALGWLVLPVTILSKFIAKNPRGRVAAFVLVVTLWILAPMAGSMFSFMLGRGFDGLNDQLNPFWQLSDYSSHTDLWDYSVTVVLAALAIALQAVLALRRWSKARA